MLVKYSLKTKLIITFSLMVVFSVLIESFDLIYIQRPHNYVIEAKSDEKDILRIKNAFQSMANELSVITYDNAVWDQTYQYVDNRNADYTEENFIKDAFVSLNINGIHLYNKNLAAIWGRVYSKNHKELKQFLPFSEPNNFVKNNILISTKLHDQNKKRPLKRAGYIFLDNELILFSAASIFHSNAQGDFNGTLVFWRYIDEKMLKNLQTRSGIAFNINIITDRITDYSATSYAHGSLRNAAGYIHSYLPFFSGRGAIKISYQAPRRLFDINWFNRSTVITLGSFSFILLTLTLLTHFIIIKPILTAGKQIKSIVKNNDRTSRFNNKRTDELGSLFRFIDSLLASIASQEQELISHNLRLQQISETDSLTQIANRRAFDLYMARLFSFSPAELSLSLLVCDVDYFKNYNDFYGHAKGDNALRQIAICLQNNLHQGTDFVARYGGEEFVIVLKNTKSHEASSVAKNLLQSIINLRIHHEKSSISSVVTISIGIYSFQRPRDNDDIKTSQYYFEKADKALYSAKNKGRNRSSHYIDP